MGIGDAEFGPLKFQLPELSTDGNDQLCSRDLFLCSQVDFEREAAGERQKR